MQRAHWREAEAAGNIPASLMDVHNCDRMDRYFAECEHSNTKAKNLSGLVVASMLAAMQV